MKCFGLKGGAG